MSHHLKEVHLEGEGFAQYDVAGTGAEAKTLRKLSKINLLVGANNSGKSRFMRSLALIEKLHFVPQQNFERFQQIADVLPTQLQHACTAYNVDDANGFVARAHELKSGYSFREGESVFAPLKKLVAEIAGATQLSTVKGSLTTQGSHRPLVASFKAIVGPFLTELGALETTLPTKYEFKRVYIPTLRGLRRLGAADDFYEKRTREDYFKSAQYVDVFTGLTLYDDLRELLLGTFSERRAAVDFETFLSEAFFGNQPVTLIPRKEVIEVKIGDEPQLPIFALGDGIQSIIVLTFPLFQRKGESLLLFVEEPELFLHPGMQRLFLDVLQRPDFANAQYFLATHSNHLLDLTLDVEDISVFTFRKQLEEGESLERLARITIENVSNDDERSLQLLGIQNSSVFLSNSTIWVEGITDRRYFAHYLNLFQQHLRNDARGNSLPEPRRFRQDLHFSFVEYAGANITHFSFLEEESDPVVVERLCAKAFLITDKDMEKETRHASLAEKLKDRYYCLKCREVENLLTPDTIAAVVRSYEGADAVLQPFTQASYRNEPLGKFIEKKILTGAQKRKGKYQSDGGTVSDKVTFCQKALEHIKKFDDLSPEAQLVTKTIYDFISAMNP